MILFYKLHCFNSLGGSSGFLEQLSVFRLKVLEQEVQCLLALPPNTVDYVLFPNNNRSLCCQEIFAADFAVRVHWRRETEIQEYVTSVLAGASSSVFNCTGMLLVREKSISGKLYAT